MDIASYLRRTIRDVRDPDLTSEEPLLSWMIASLSELSMTAPIGVIPISSSDVSHKYVRFSGRHYVVWDVALNEILWRFLVGMQYERLATDAGEGQESTQLRELASMIFRHTLFSYLAQKLTRFPRTAVAFAKLASEEPIATQSVPVLEGDLIEELLAMQRLLMFYHETTHALHVERDDLRSQAMAALARLLKRLPTIVADESALAADLNIAFPEIAASNDEQRLAHFAEELNCDLQAFVFASMALPKAPGFQPRAWQDSIGMLFGASALLAALERMLKLSVSKWTEFARESSDGAELTTRSIAMEQYLRDRPLFYVRRWNTMIAIGQVLERLGKARAEDALAWQEYVVVKTQGLIEALEEYLVREHNALATIKFIAKVASRAQV
jgi:hypothetical protein